MFAIEAGSFSLGLAVGAGATVALSIGYVKIGKRSVHQKQVGRGAGPQMQAGRNIKIGGPTTRD